MNDYTPNLREIACVIKHKAHLSIQFRGSIDDTCIYCHTDMSNYEIREAQPCVRIWKGLKQVAYLLSNGQIREVGSEYYETFN